MKPKVKNFQLILILGVLLFLMFLPTKVQAANVTMTFQDANLFTAIKTSMGSKVISSNSNNHTITATREDIDSITTLHLDKKNITDISGIENFRNLKTLNLGQNSISDISDLSGLTSIEYLYLNENKDLENISALSALSSIEYLQLSDTNVEDLSPITGKTELTNLILTNTKITSLNESLGLTGLFNVRISSPNISDISGFSIAPNLQYLNLDGTNITDISPLSGLTNLKNVFLNNTNITDISALSGKTSISFLSLYGSKGITSIPTSLGLTGLVKVDLLNTNISDISGLSIAPNLETLSLDNNTKITDISPLSGLTNLKDVSLNNTNITDISALSGKTNLKYLYMNQTNISDISALSGLTNLEKLNLCLNSQIRDLSPLSGLRKLKELYASTTLISDISPIANITSLEKIDFNYTLVNDISALTGLSNLKEVKLDKVQSTNDVDRIEDISALAGKTQLTNLSIKYNKIKNVNCLENLTNLTYLDCYGQTITINTYKREIDLPPIFVSAKNADSCIYTDANFRFTNCRIENNKIIVDQDANIATIKINGGKAQETVLTITMSKPTDLTINSNPEKIEYIEGENFDPDGLLIVVTYDSGEEREITDYKIEPARPLILGDDKVTVIYEENGEEVSIYIPVTVIEKLEDIQFVDVNMYNAVIENLSDNIAECIDDTLTIRMRQEKIDAVTALDLKNKEITDLSGIENFKNLHGIQMQNNQVTSLEPLSSLETLSYLYMNDNNVSDLSPLSEITTLSSLAAPSNNITNIDCLNKLTQMRMLNLSGNELDSIDVVSNFGEITELILFNVGVEDITPISGLTEIQRLNLSSNNISNIEPLSNLNKLTRLYLDNNKISDITPISSIETLRDFSIERQVLEQKENKSLPQIFNAAEDENSLVYTTNTFVLEGCTFTEEGKVVLLDGQDTGTVTIVGGTADRTVINIIQKVLTRIEVIGELDTPEFVDGQEFNPGGITIIAEYDNGDREEITNYTVEPDRPLELGDDKVIIRYEENGEIREIEIPVTVVPKVLDRIEITKGPDKTEYVEGESFDRTGMEVVAIYNDGERVVIEDYEVEPSGPLTLEDTVIKVKYEGQEDTLNIGENGITINPKPEEEIEVEIDEELVVEEDGDLIYIKEIQPKTMISTVLEKIRTNGEIQVYDKEQNREEDFTKYATSDMKVRIVKGEKQIEYILVVRGDTNGDGDANFSDMLKINKHRLEKVLLEGAYLRAGNVNTDEVANFSDMLKINKYRLGKLEIL